METAGFQEGDSPHVQLAYRVVGFTGILAPSVMPVQDNSHESLWAYWNFLIVAAAERLMRSQLVLMENGYEPEAHLPARSLLDLHATQAYMRADISRVTKLILQVPAGKGRLLEMLRKMNLIESSEYESALALNREERTGLTSLFGQISKKAYNDYRPFGISAKKRFEKAGLDWLYDSFFTVCSDYVHMGARALDLFADSSEKGVRLTKEPNVNVGILVIATQILLRIDYMADEAMKTGKSAQIDEMATAWWESNKAKGLELADFLRMMKEPLGRS